MSLSAITLTVRDDFASDLAAFTLAGLPYLMWRAPVLGASRIWWRAHNGAEGTEVTVPRLMSYAAIAAAGRPDGLTVLIVYTASAAEDAPIYSMVCNVATGAVVVEPVAIASGSRPALAPLLGNGDRIALAYLDGRTRAVHLRETYDGGRTWSTARPVLNDKVAASSDLSLVAFGESHLSIGQVGTAGRNLAETGAVTRSRPVTSIAVLGGHRLAVAEAVVRTGQVADNLRGRLALDGAGNILAGSMTRQGADDTVGSLAVYDTFLNTPTLVESAILAAGAAPGGEIVRAPWSPAGAGAVIATVSGLEAILDLVAHAGHVLYAASASTALTGKAGWVNLTDLTAGEFALGAGVTRVGAVAAATVAAGGFDLVAVGYTASGAEWLRFGEWLTPPGGVVLNDLHAMPAKVNSLGVSITSPTAGFLYVGMVDRLNVYAYDGVGQPIRLLVTHPLLTGGEVLQIVALDNGNVVAALGSAGVAVYGPSGETLGVATPSTLAAMPWKPNTAYGLGALVRPSNGHPYVGARRYYTCTRGGTSGRIEPAWGPSGTFDDPSAAGVGWTYAGSVEPIIAGVAVDQAAGRIFAAGVIGGATATQGRIYCFDAAGLVNAPPRCAPPLYTVAEGDLRLDPTRVEIKTGSAGATIYYTTDGSEPGPNATLYDPDVGLFYIKSGSYHIRAVAVAPGLAPSIRTELHFTIDLPNIAPVLASPEPGTYVDEIQQVTLICATIDVEIRYTTDGSEPTETHGTIFTGTTIAVGQTGTIRARAFRYGMDDSPLADLNYTITWHLIPVDPAAVSHFLISNGAVVDANGSRGWDQIGAVPKVTLATPVAGRPVTEGMGPFATANYYRLTGSGAGTDVFDTLFNGDFTMTLILKIGAATDEFFSNWGGSSVGLLFGAVAAQGGVQVFTGGGLTARAPVPSLLDGNPHVITFGRKGTTWYWKTDKNVGASGTISFPAGTPGNTETRIGRSVHAGGVFTGLLYEARFLTGGPNSLADLDALHGAIIP